MTLISRRIFRIKDEIARLQTAFRRRKVQLIDSILIDILHVV